MNDNRRKEKEPVARSEGFTEKPAPVAVAAGPTRDESLAIVEELTPGPAEHKPPPDDPNFEKVEPNSGIRLRYVHSALNFSSIQLLTCMGTGREYFLMKLSMIIYTVVTSYRLHSFIPSSALILVNKGTKFRSTAIG